MRAKFCTEEALSKVSPQTALIEGILDEGLTLLYGHPGTYKSFVAVSWAVSIAAGKPWYEDAHTTDRGTVVYIAAEGNAMIGHRVREAKRALGIHEPIPLLIYPAAVQLMTVLQGQKTEELEEFVREMLVAVGEAGYEPPKLIVVDTLARNMLGGDENKQQDANAFVAGADYIREQVEGCSVLLVHHAAKKGVGPRGSSVFLGAVDGAYEAKAPLKKGKKEAEPMPTNAMAIDLVCVKRKDDVAKSIYLEMAEAEIRDSDGKPIEFPVAGSFRTKHKSTLIVKPRMVTSTQVVMLTTKQEEVVRAFEALGITSPETAIPNLTPIREFMHVVGYAINDTVKALKKKGMLHVTDEGTLFAKRPAPKVKPTWVNPFTRVVEHEDWSPEQEPDDPVDDFDDDSDDEEE